MRPLAFLLLLAMAPLIACHSAPNPNCTANLSRYTDDENEALAQYHAGDYSSAFEKFGKAGQSRIACTQGVDRRTEGMNSGYAAFDAAGQAAAAKRLGRDEEAQKIMASAKRLAADVLTYEEIPPTMRWSMQKIANK